MDTLFVLWVVGAIWSLISLLILLALASDTVKSRYKIAVIGFFLELFFVLFVFLFWKFPDLLSNIKIG